ncbi:MAG: hypothetical protein ACYSUY_01190 [Planctomycetota bacterium]
MEDQRKPGSEDTQTLAKSRGVGSSVAAFGTAMLIFGAISSYFSGSISYPDTFCGISLLVLGIESRKGKRVAMKVCIGLSGFCLLGSLLGTALVLSTLLVSEGEVEVLRLAYLCFCLTVAVLFSLWCVTNIVWLFKVLKKRYST